MSNQSRRIQKLTQERERLLAQLNTPDHRFILSEAQSWRPEWVRKSAGAVLCGARRHRDGNPCEARVEPGKRRCRFHGGRSTGPRTEAGKARSLANLRKGARGPGG